jgi:hypothetical protein
MKTDIIATFAFVNSVFQSVGKEVAQPTAFSETPAEILFFPLICMKDEDRYILCNTSFYINTFWEMRNDGNKIFRRIGS